MSDQERAQQLIVGGLAASTAVAAGSLLAQGQQPTGRMFVGVAFTGLGLATVAMVAPGFAGGMAVLILTTTVIVYGEPLFGLITNLTAGTPGSTKATADPNVTGVPAQPKKETATA